MDDTVSIISDHQNSNPIDALNTALQRILGHAKVCQQTISLERDIALWLIDPSGWDSPLSEQQVDAAFDAPPYWSFCWGSGKALADKLLKGDIDIAGKRVLDFGSGSGVVAIAAAMACAAQVICCDNDPLALEAAKANAELNQVKLDYLDNLESLDKPVDILFAADVLYDPDNLSLLDKFCQLADQVVIADSRVKNFSARGFSLFDQIDSITEPDLGENRDVYRVRFYQSVKQSGC